MKKKYKYKSLFVFSSFQFIGNIEEYFLNHTEKLVVHIVMPRIRNKYNIVRLYSYGRLVKEEKLWSTENFFLYYSSWYIQHWYILLRYFSYQEDFFVITYMPLVLFFSSIQKLFRKVTYVYFIGDYCPSKDPIIVLSEKIKKYYHDHTTYACYLSDTINKLMNGKIVTTKNRKTVMWGVKPSFVKKKLNRNFSLLFVGLIKESQGIEFFLEFLQHEKEYFIYLLGVGDKQLYKKYHSLIKKYKIEKQVYFPNKFFSDNEVKKIAQKCHAGVALYDTGPSNMTYYTEPGKVKFYAELGLPVIMSNVSAIVPYIKKFQSGEVIERDSKSLAFALQRIKKYYPNYLSGLKKFNEYFYFETYYAKRFTFLEKK